MIKENEDIIHFEEFTRKGTSVLICLFGFSGCGKTLSAINIAKGLGGKTFFLDTETGRGRVYAEDAKGFTYGELTPPFTPERYIAAFKQIQRAGFDNLILDSGSHEWDGLGGMLEIADNKEIAAGKNIGLAKWSVKNRHKSFMGTLMASRMNIIICLRAKDRYVQEGKGKDMEIYTDGFVAIQERNFKYDMMIQLPMPEDGQGRYLMERTRGFKCPRDLLPAFEEGKQINFEIGAKIAEWIRTGQPMDEALRQLKAEALEQAEAGAIGFRAYWKGLSAENRLKLQPFLNNFQNVAKTVDAERAVLESPHLPINTSGVDLSSLTDKPRALSPDELTAAIEQNPVKIKPQTFTRHKDDADWHAVIDDLRPRMMECKNGIQLANFIMDNEKIIRALDKAPERVQPEWQHTVEMVNEKIMAARKKAA